MTRVLLTGTGPEHRYVANHLVESGGVDLVLVEQGRVLSKRSRVEQLLRRYGVAGVGSRSAVAVYRAVRRDSRAKENALLRVLGSKSVAFDDPSVVRTVESVNDRAARDIVGELGDVRLLVYGTGIVGQRMLQLSDSTPLNMHTGMSPEYRGSGCAFWPVHNDELQYVGATVHEVTSRVDGGRIYAVAPAELEPEDGLHEIFGRAVVEGTKLYLDVLARLDDPGYEASASRQDLSVGVEYRASMRGLRAEWRARRAIRRGSVRQFCENRDLAL